MKQFLKNCRKKLSLVLALPLVFSMMPPANVLTYNEQPENNAYYYATTPDYIYPEYGNDYYNTINDYYNTIEDELYSDYKNSYEDEEKYYPDCENDGNEVPLEEMIPATFALAPYSGFDGVFTLSTWAEAQGLVSGDIVPNVHGYPQYVGQFGTIHGNWRQGTVRYMTGDGYDFVRLSPSNPNYSHEPAFGFVLPDDYEQVRVEFQLRLVQPDQPRNQWNDHMDGRFISGFRSWDATFGGYQIRTMIDTRAYFQGHDFQEVRTPYNPNNTLEDKITPGNWYSFAFEVIKDGDEYTYTKFVGGEEMASGVRSANNIDFFSISHTFMVGDPGEANRFLHIYDVRNLSLNFGDWGTTEPPPTPEFPFTWADDLAVNELGVLQTAQPGQIGILSQAGGSLEFVPYAHGHDNVVRYSQNANEWPTIPSFGIQFPEPIDPNEALTATFSLFVPGGIPGGPNAFVSAGFHAPGNNYAHGLWFKGFSPGDGNIAFEVNAINTPGGEHIANPFGRWLNFTVISNADSVMISGPGVEFSSQRPRDNADRFVIEIRHWGYANSPFTYDPFVFYIRDLNITMGEPYVPGPTENNFPYLWANDLGVDRTEANPVLPAEAMRGEFGIISSDGGTLTYVEQSSDFPQITDAIRYEFPTGGAANPNPRFGIIFPEPIGPEYILEVEYSLFIPTRSGVSNNNVYLRGAFYNGAFAPNHERFGIMFKCSSIGPEVSSTNSVTHRGWQSPSFIQFEQTWHNFRMELHPESIRVHANTPEVNSEGRFYHVPPDGWEAGFPADYVATAHPLRSPVDRFFIDKYIWDNDHTANPFVMYIYNLNITKRPAAPGGAPTLRTPADQAVDVSAITRFEWSNTGADSYILEVSTTNEFLPGYTVTVPDITGISHTLAMALPNETLHFWRVTAVYNNDDDATSEIFSFTTVEAEQQGGAPTLLTPADGAINTLVIPTFTWTGTAADRYVLEIFAAGANINGTPTHSFTTTALTHSPFGIGEDESLEWGSVYRWRVRAEYDSAEPDANSDYFTFTTRSAPPKSLTPQNDVVIDTLQPAFTWDSGAWPFVSFELATNINFNPAVHIASNLTGATTSLDLVAAGVTLQPGTTYFWRVTGTDGSLTSFPLMFDVFSFTTPGDAPVGNFPFLWNEDLAVVGGVLQTVTEGQIGIISDTGGALEYVTDGPGGEPAVRYTFNADNSTAPSFGVRFPEPVSTDYILTAEFSIFVPSGMRPGPNNFIRGTFHGSGIGGNTTYCAMVKNSSSGTPEITSARNAGHVGQIGGITHGRWIDITFELESSSYTLTSGDAELEFTLAQPRNDIDRFDIHLYMWEFGHAGGPFLQDPFVFYIRNLNIYATPRILGGAPTLIAPANNATNIAVLPTFMWSDTGADNYVLEIFAPGYPVTGTPTHTFSTTNVSYTLSSVLNWETAYSWRVRAEYNDTQVYDETSGVWIFTTAVDPVAYIPPPRPANQGPAWNNVPAPGQNWVLNNALAVGERLPEFTRPDYTPYGVFSFYGGAQGSWDNHEVIESHIDDTGAPLVRVVYEHTGRGNTLVFQLPDAPVRFGTITADFRMYRMPGSTQHWMEAGFGQGYVGREYGVAGAMLGNYIHVGPGMGWQQGGMPTFTEGGWFRYVLTVDLSTQMMRLDVYTPNATTPWIFTHAINNDGNNREINHLVIRAYDGLAGQSGVLFIADVAVSYTPPDPTPVLLSPADEAHMTSVAPLFAWSNTGLENYRIQIATDVSFNNIVHDANTTVNFYQTAKGILQNGTRYYWRVISFDNGYNRISEEVFSFFTEFMLTAEDLTYPIILDAGEARFGLELGDWSGFTLDEVNNLIIWDDPACTLRNGGAARNAATIQWLLDQAGQNGGGTVVLPAGIITLEGDRTHRHGIATLEFRYDNLTLKGQGIGETTLKIWEIWNAPAPANPDDPLPQDFSRRNTAMRIMGAPFGNDYGYLQGLPHRSLPRTNIIIQGMTLDGGRPFTGYDGWDFAMTDLQDFSWDVRHQGIVTANDNLVDNVILDNLHLHGFSGETLYMGGQGVGYTRVSNSILADTNASCFNLHAAVLNVFDVQFGDPNVGSRFWIEYCNREAFAVGYFGFNEATAPASIAAFDPYGWGRLQALVDEHELVTFQIHSAYFYNNTFLNAVDGEGFVLAQGNATTYYFFIVDNVFDNSLDYNEPNGFMGNGHRGMIMFAGSIYGPTYILHNVFRNVGGYIIDFNWGGGAYDADGNPNHMLNRNITFAYNTIESAGGPYILLNGVWGDGFWPFYAYTEEQVRAMGKPFRFHYDNGVPTAFVTHSPVPIIDMVVRDNTFTARNQNTRIMLIDPPGGTWFDPATGQPMVSPAPSVQLEGWIIENNTFNGGTAPEERGPFLGTLPLFRNNIYTNVRLTPYGGLAVLSAENNLIRTVFEELTLDATVAVTVDMRVGVYENGQEVRIMGNVGTAPVTFAVGNATYVVPNNKIVTETAVLTLRYNAALSLWEFVSFEDITLFTVTFDGNNGTIDGYDVYERSVIENTAVGTLPVPVREGYEFVSWNTMQDGSGIAFTDVSIIEDNITVFAQWVCVCDLPDCEVCNPACDNCDLPECEVCNPPVIFVPVVSIKGIATGGTVGVAVTLNGVINPAGATNRNIVWSVVSGPATLTNGNILTATSAGNVVVMATIIDGIAEGANFVQTFTIAFAPPPPVPPAPTPTPPPPVPPAPTPPFPPELSQPPILPLVPRPQQPPADDTIVEYEEDDVAPIGDGENEERVAIPTPPSINTLIFTVGNIDYLLNTQTRTGHGVPFIDPATDRMMIPLRTLSEALGTVVEWDSATRSAIIHLPTGVTLVIPTDEMLPDGMGSAILVDDRVFIPIRFVMYAFNANVRWDSANRAAVITW